MAQVKAFSLGGLGACCGRGPVGCVLSICVTGCPAGAAVVGATVTVKTTGGTTTGSCTAVSDGAGHACCPVNIPAAGTYEIIVTATGYRTYDGTKSVSCGDTVTIALQPTSQSAATVKFTVTGCCGKALPGAMVTLSDGQSATTDSGGLASFWIGGTGTFTYTVSKVRFADSAGSFAVGGPCYSGGTITESVAMLPASGYHCGPAWDADGTTARPDPIPDTLTLSDSLYGGCSLTYFTTAPVAGMGAPGWTGVISGALFAGGCNCPSASFSLRYALYPCTAGATLTAIYNGAAYTACFSGTIADKCPADPADCATCTGFGINRLNNCEDCVYGVGGTPGSTECGAASWLFGGTNWTIAPGLPFDLTATIASIIGTCSSISQQTVAWPSGATLTITE